MTCRFCFKVRRSVEKIVGSFGSHKFEYEYLKGFRNRFPQPGRLLYVLDVATPSNPKEDERFVHVPPSAEIYAGSNHGMEMAAKALSLQGVQNAIAIADLSTGKVIKNRNPGQAKFEDFFYYYFGSMNNLERKYYEYLRQAKAEELV